MISDSGFKGGLRNARNQLEVLGGVSSPMLRIATIFVSSFVSRSVQSHVFSTVLSNLAESSGMLKTGQKREK